MCQHLRFKSFNELTTERGGPLTCKQKGKLKSCQPKPQNPMQRSLGAYHVWF